MAYKSKVDFICEIEHNAIDHAYSIWKKAKKNNNPKLVSDAWKNAGKKAQQAVREKNQYKAAYHGAIMDTFAVLAGYKKI